MAPSAERFLGCFLLVGHGPWAARIELRIGARFIFLNNTISHNILHVKLGACCLELGACGSNWSMHALTSLIEGPDQDARSFPPSWP